MSHLLEPVTGPDRAGPAPRPNLYGLTRSRLAEILAGRGLPGYRAEQVFSWIYRKHHRTTTQMSNLPLVLRTELTEILDFALPGVEQALGTPDGETYKFVLKLADGARLECVSMRTPRGLTFCLSSQVGCALKCSFCATGLMGLERNLQPHEIVAQVVLMGDFHGWEDEGFNLVFMGMGEPLANYDAVIESIRIMHDPQGLNMGHRRVTVSTSGLVPQVRRLAAEHIPVGLAVSLHATTDEVRDQLVPVNKRWPMQELLDAARDYGHESGRRVTLEYTLIAGVNDTADDATRVAAIARNLPSKINLIPYNPVPGLPWQRPSQQAVDRFAERLYPHAPAVTVRNTMGGEIWAACGQLGGLSPHATDS